MQEASDKGGLHRKGAEPGSLPELGFVLATALDIANGMACIHSHDVIHRWALRPACRVCRRRQRMASRPLQMTRPARCMVPGSIFSLVPAQGQPL